MKIRAYFPVNRFNCRSASLFLSFDFSLQFLCIIEPLENSKEKLSVKSKTPFISNRHQPLSREGVLDAELDTVTQKSKKKDQVILLVKSIIMLKLMTWVFIV